MNRPLRAWSGLPLILLALWLFPTDARADALGDAVSGRKTSAAKRALRELLEANDLASLKRILLALQTEGLSQTPEVYAVLLHAAAGFTNPEALQHLGDAVVEGQGTDWGRDLAARVLSNRNPGVVRALRRFLQGSIALQLLALEALAELRDPAAVAALIEFLGEKGPPFVKRACREALVTLTGADHAQDAQAWSAWWEANGRKLPAKTRGSTRTRTTVDAMDALRSQSYERLKSARLIVVSGRDCTLGWFDHDYDDLDEILLKMGLKATVVSRVELESKKYRLPRDTAAVLMNCVHWRAHCGCPKCVPSGRGSGGPRSGGACVGCSVHTKCEDPLGPRAAQKLVRYVKGGGYLFTEDWVLEDFLSKAWPKLVGVGPRMGAGGVEVLPAPGLGTHPYLRRVFGQSLRASGDPGSGTWIRQLASERWTVDAGSPTVVVRDTERVSSLIVSDYLRENFEGNATVALTFSLATRKVPASEGTHPQDRARMRGGRVLHVLSHFGKQSSRGDEYALQELLLNFLIEANERRVKPWKSKD